MPVSVMVLITMTVVVAVLAVYRKVVARNEDDYVHLADPTGQVINNQRKVARALNQVDRLGVGLTVLTALYGVALFATYVIAEYLRRGRM